jgi:hypothetical protein
VTAAPAAASAAAGRRSAQQQRFLALAERGVASARRAWRDDSQSLFVHRRNRRISWYDERLADHDRYPLATIWGSVPLWESLAAVAIADPSAANRAALERFAQGPPHASFAQGAEAYWDPHIRPAPGYAPYPGDRGNPNTWCDDNAWWGLGFLDSYRALGLARYLTDAQRAFNFVARACWDGASGGIWWNTRHIPNHQKAGEPLAAGSLLGALLAQTYLGQATSAARQRATFDLQNTEEFLAWGDAHFANSDGLYWRTGQDATPMPYVEGAAIEAKEVLCQIVGQPYCEAAAALADAAYARFRDRLNMGPQYDAIYLHWMLIYGRQSGEPRWASLALEMAGDALANSVDPTTGLYLKAWDGSSMASHQAAPGMLRTHAATVELFAWLAAEGS